MKAGIIPTDKSLRCRSGPSSLGPSLGPTAFLRLRLKQHKKSNATSKNVNTAVEATAMISFINMSSFFARGGGGGGGGRPGTLLLGVGFLLVAVGAGFESSGVSAGGDEELAGTKT